MTKLRMKSPKVVGLLLASTLLAAGCHQDMWNQPKAKAQSLSDSMFSNGSNSRLPVAGTIAFDRARPDQELFTGYGSDGKLLKEFPVAVDEKFLARGQNRFRIFCTPCHGEVGDGKGFIAQRGFTLARPVGNYHSDRLRNMPVGHFFDVISNGYGTMFPFRSRIKPIDRWAIAAYIRVLQTSQHTSIDSIPMDKRTELEALEASPDQNAAPEPKIGAPPSRDLNKPGGAVTTVPLGRRTVGTTVPLTENEETTAATPGGTGQVNPRGGRR